MTDMCAQLSQNDITPVITAFDNCLSTHRFRPGLGVMRCLGGLAETSEFWQGWCAEKGECHRGRMPIFAGWCAKFGKQNKKVEPVGQLVW
ncbi:hypothetical protein PGTUg99_034305 [Puccinia graminis f. sp. tritici]|uniref:Uncharacterized protein n=1 Tax=Puccinia graminis f. sp. tritici TaxID=56615 RepID=A0A5B0S8S1_PUCGR|nr:hypothetical protein PGTUg99_034305 [Puccinia graminis f. sp. tritici]